MRMRQLGNDALYRGQEWGSLSQVQYGVGLWAKWVHWSWLVGIRVSQGAQEGSNKNQYQYQNWDANVGWVKGPWLRRCIQDRWKDLELRRCIYHGWRDLELREMHLGWVEGPQAEEMRAGWVQVYQDQLQPERLLHADHGPQLHLCLGLLQHTNHNPYLRLGLGLQQHANHDLVHLGVLRLCSGLQQLLIQSHANCLLAHLLQDHHQAQPWHLGRAGRGCVLGCPQEASPTTHYGFQSETEKEPVQSDLRHLCINYRMDNIVLINC